MMKRVSLQPAYVLHRRPYRESSFLVEIFTKEHGRLTLVARGGRGARSSTQGLLQPFVPLLISWAGKGELMALSHVEVGGIAPQLKGECLFAGFYLNELMMALLQKWDAHTKLYLAYAATLKRLEADHLQQQYLRVFEKCLLEELGYGVLPSTASALERAFSPDHYYRFIPEQGFIVSDQREVASAQGQVFSGKSLLAIAREEWHVPDSLQDAKRLSRVILNPLLGARILHSRHLFIQREEESKNG